MGSAESAIRCTTQRHTARGGSCPFQGSDKPSSQWHTHTHWMCDSFRRFTLFSLAAHYTVLGFGWNFRLQKKKKTVRPGPMLSISIFVRLGQANSFIDESHHQTRANSALCPYQGEMVASGRANFRTNRLEGFVHLTGRYDFPCFFFFFFFERFKGSHLEPHKTPNLLPYSIFFPSQHN